MPNDILKAITTTYELHEKINVVVSIIICLINACHSL